MSSLHNRYISLLSYNICLKENMLYSSAIQTISFSPQKFARDRNDRDYYIDRYTYSDTLILWIYISIIKTTVSWIIRSQISSRRVWISQKKCWSYPSYKINHVEMIMNNMYKLLCIKYNDHEQFSIVHSVMPTIFWKYVCPTLFKYNGDLAKTGDKSSLLDWRHYLMY